MKKTFLAFSEEHAIAMKKRFLPKSTKKWARFAAYKSDGGDEDEDDDEVKDKSAQLLKTIEKRMKKQLEGRATKEEIEKLTNQVSFLSKGKNEKGEVIDAPFPIEALRALADDKTGILKQFTDMSVKVQKLESAATQEVKKVDIRSQVADWHEKNKALLERIKNGEKGVSLPTMELRVAASPMLVSTVNSGSSPYIGRVEVEPGINEILVRPNTFWDIVPKGRTGAPTYVWVNKTNRQGAAAFIGPGVAKPGISFELVAESSNAKKIADSAKAGTELLQDIDGMVTFIEQELKVQVMLKMNSTLMTGVVSSTVPAGIQTLSQNFAFYADAAANIRTKNANYMDAIRTVVAALRSGLLTGDITVFVNSIDAANMDLSKATDSGVYLLPPFTTSNGQTIAGARIVEDNNVPVGYIQAAFLRYYRILIYKDFTVDWGWENDDFTKNLVTAVGEMRIHQFVNSINAGFALYDTFENVIAAINQA